MIYLSTTNEQGFIYYFGIFYLKIGKFYTFFQLGKGPVMGPKISPGKSLHVILMSMLIYIYFWKQEILENFGEHQFSLSLWTVFVGSMASNRVQTNSFCGLGKNICVTIRTSHLYPQPLCDRG